MIRHLKDLCNTVAVMEGQHNATFGGALLDQ